MTCRPSAVDSTTMQPVVSATIQCSRETGKLPTPLFTSVTSASARSTSSTLAKFEHTHSGNSYGATAVVPGRAASGKCA